MTEVANTVATVATAEVVRKLNAAEAVYSLEFVTKLVKKIAKDNPSYTIAQIVSAMDAAFASKLTTMTKKLAGLEKVQREYALIRSAQPMVEAVGDALHHAATLDYVDHVMPAAVAKKPAAKANGKANGAAKQDANQPSML